MIKASFCCILLLAMSSVALGFKYTESAASIGSNSTHSAIKCFAEQIIPQNLHESTTINNEFIEEIKTFLIKANPEVFTKNGMKACLEKLSMVDTLNACKTKNNNNDCEIVNHVLAAPKCPSDMTRLTGIDGQDSTTCFQKCPEGFKENGVACEKPETYILNPYTQEIECNAANGGKPCPIYHVRYFVPDCKDNFYRLGSTVCIPKCPRDFADYETFCLRPELKMANDKVVSWTVHGNNL